MEHTFMMVLDHVGDQEAIVYAQLGQQPLVRTTAPSTVYHLGLPGGRSPGAPSVCTSLDTYIYYI